jgi:hypothetical protein
MTEMRLVPADEESRFWAAVHAIVTRSGRRYRKGTVVQELHGTLDSDGTVEHPYVVWRLDVTVREGPDDLPSIVSDSLSPWPRTLYVVRGDSAADILSALARRLGVPEGEGDAVGREEGRALPG